jgi:hypothetical protein
MLPTPEHVVGHAAERHAAVERDTAERLPQKPAEVHVAVGRPM